MHFDNFIELIKTLIRNANVQRSSDIVEFFREILDIRNSEKGSRFRDVLVRIFRGLIIMDKGFYAFTENIKNEIQGIIVI